jgi:hypothetical protein
LQPEATNGMPCGPVYIGMYPAPRHKICIIIHTNLAFAEDSSCRTISYDAIGGSGFLRIKIQHIHSCLVRTLFARRPPLSRQSRLGFGSYFLSVTFIVLYSSESAECFVFETLYILDRTVLPPFFKTKDDLFFEMIGHFLCLNTFYSSQRTECIGLRS